ncbi:hypothetical protein PQX77_003429 [Marasmius sp. AFHP31]|nr:hypothetical protein PQX77_003429 [Marasmius sp. AFHP31]
MTIPNEHIHDQSSALDETSQELLDGAPGATQTNDRGSQAPDPTKDTLSTLLESSNISVDSDLLSVLSSGDGSPDSPTLARDILGALLSQDSAATGVETHSVNESDTQIQPSASPSEEENKKSGGTALVGMLFDIGIKIVDPSRYAGRKLQVYLHVDNKQVMAPIQFKEGWQDNQMATLLILCGSPLYVGSIAIINVLIDGIPQGITSPAEQWGIAEVLREMPLRSQDVLFDLGFLIQFPDSSWQGDSPLDFLANKFSLLVSTMATLESKPHMSTLWISAGVLVHATCSNARGREPNGLNDLLVQPLLSMILDAAIAFFAHGETVWTSDLARSVGEHITSAVCEINEAVTGHGRFGTRASQARRALALDATRLCMQRLSEQYGQPSLAKQVPSAPEMVEVYNQPMDRLRGAVFDITTSATPKRIRFVDCRRLLEHGHLRVVELEDYNAISQVPYSAISYVWRSNYRDENPDALPTGSSGTFVVKDVELDGDPISIDILLCAAKVSLDSGLPFTWVDRLCIIQKEVVKLDKSWQLERMHSLYQGSGQCIICPDGLFTMALPEQHSPWLERIWTMEEGLLPENAQILFAWKRGPGILVDIDREAPDFSGAVVGYIEQVDDTTGMTNLMSLLQFSGPVAFVDEAARRSTDVKFNIFQGSGLHTFSTVFSLFKTRDPEVVENSRDDVSVVQFRYSPHEVSLWHSAFLRDATYKEDIILILARFLGFEKREGGEKEKGLQRYKMNERQRLTFAKALEMIPLSGIVSQRSHHFNWTMQRLMYDLFYAFDISSIYNYLALPPYNCPFTIPSPVNRTELPPTAYDATLYLSSLTKPPSDLSIETLGQLIATPPDSVKSIVICGDIGNSSDNTCDPLSTGILMHILELLPDLHCLALRRLAISVDDKPYIPSRTIPQVEFDNVRALTSLHDFTALLSLLNIGNLWIRGPLSPPLRPTPEAPSTSSLPAASTLNTRPEPEFPADVSPIHGIRSLYMSCSAAESLLWLSGLIDIGGRSGGADGDGKKRRNGDPGSLRKVDVVCEDVRAAYILGDFLRSTAGSSVDHLVLDLIQPEDPVRALMHHYPHRLRILTLRTQWPITNPAALDNLDNQKNWNQVVMALETAHYIRTILAVVYSGPREIDTCELEVDIGNDASHTLETLLAGLATYHVADTLRSYLDYGWPRLSKAINFVWRRPAIAHKSCTIEAEQLLTGVFRALQIHQNKTARLRDVDVSELTEWCEGLLKEGIVTSRWELY